MVAALAALTLLAASAGAQDASDVTISAEWPNGLHGAGTTGTFIATGVLCPSGTIVVDQGAIVHTLTCDDDSGSFNIGFSGPHTGGFSNTWHFVGHGTGDFAIVTGGGDTISSVCDAGNTFCTTDLTGVAAIR
jgi:hypothetical protein